MGDRYEPFDWYAEPLYYDIVFDQGTTQEASFLEAMVARYGQSKSRQALEPACGSGRLVEALAQRNWHVTGFDLSTEMLEMAQQRIDQAKLNPQASLVQASMAEFSLGNNFGLAWNLVSTFRYLASDEDAQNHLHCMADALDIGGIYVLGLHLSDYTYDKIQHERWVAQRDDIKVVCNIRSWPADRETRTEPCRARLVVTGDSAHSQPMRKLETCWKFRTYDLGELLALLESESRLEHVGTYSFDHDPDEPIVLGLEHWDAVLILRRR